MAARNLETGHLAGRLVRGGHELAVRVYYEDTDFAGVVYHANYLKYCERGRSDYLRLLGLDQRALHDGSFAGAEDVRGNFAVRAMQIKFLKAARMDDVLKVATRLAQLKPARILLDQTISREGEAVFEAAVEVVLISPGGRPLRLPQAVERAFG